MKVILVGLPYFSSYLQEKLSIAYPEHQFVALDTYYNKKDKLKYLTQILNADVLHSINGTIDKSMVFELAFKLNKKVVMHWVGTDLLTAEKAYASGDYNRQFISNATHLTDTPWFVERLKALGIENPQFIPLKGFSSDAKLMPLPKNFEVLCYIPEHRAEFYGIQQAIEIALALPEITFNWLGIKQWKEELPANVKLHGWVNNMGDFIHNSVVSLRMPKADGLSFFVLENLFNCRYVAYNQEFDISKTCIDSKEFIQYIQELKTRFDAGKLKENLQAAKEVQKQFNEEKVFSSIFAQYH
jgi:hypothetical protein